jgi:hypothetical protein
MVPTRVAVRKEDCPMVGAAIAIPATVAGATEVEFLLDGAPIGRQTIAAPGNVTLSPEGFVAQAVGAHVLEIRAEDCGRAVWRAFRVVNVTP